MDLEIFDKNGNKLNLSNVIYNLMDTIASNGGKDLADVFIGANNIWPKKDGIGKIYFVESIENGYDGIDLVELD